MTSVNSPACLLARNHFYRHLPTGEEQMRPALSRQSDPAGHKSRRVTLWVTVATPTGAPGSMRTRALWVNVVLNSSTPQFPASKPASPADRGVK